MNKIKSLHATQEALRYTKVSDPIMCQLHMKRLEIIASIRLDLEKTIRKVMKNETNTFKNSEYPPQI